LIWHAFPSPTLTEAVTVSDPGIGFVAGFESAAGEWT